MQTHNLPTLFDESQFTESDRAFLIQKELRIKSILMQSASEVGRELHEARKWFADNHKRGFEAWVKEKFGYTPEHAHRFMDIAEKLPEATYMLLPGISLSTQLQLAKSPDPEEAVNEALIRQQIEGEVTEKKAKEIAEYQRAERIARDEARSTQERATALDRQLSYIKQQLAATQKKLSEQPKVVEKVVEKEVIPPNLQARENGLRDQISRLQERERALTRERDSYRKQLDEERAVAYARRVENREGENAERIRVMFAEATRDYLRSERVFLSRLPSLSDTGAFEADDWQRLNEVKESVKLLIRELDKFTSHTSEQGQLFIVDSSIAV